jgi:hypothetical protein
VQFYAAVIRALHRSDKKGRREGKERRPEEVLEMAV